MKFFKLLLLLNLPAIVVYGQDIDTTLTKSHTLNFRTTNAFLTPRENYETFNNSFITGNSVATVRCQDNPRILVDGIPINPILLNNTDYNEFLGHMHLLSYDIQGVNVNTLQNDSRIVSGNYNNAISFNTSDIQLGKSAYQFEANNLTTLAYQDFDSMGYSTIFNFKVQKSYEKFGYRVSLNNGFQNDYIPENGLQRYGGNLKLKYNPFKPLLLTGFLDYTHFEDFKRSGENIITSNRLFTYINADFNLTESLLIYGKYSYNNVSDTSKRELNFYRESSIYGQYRRAFYEKNKYKYASSYFDIGLNFKKLIEGNTSIDLTLGYNLNSLNYFDEVKTDDSYAGSRNYYKREPEETEKEVYTALKLQSKHLTLSYLFNKTYFGLDYLYYNDTEKKSFTNHLASLNYEFIKNEDKKINRLGFVATYGKLTNYSIMNSSIVAFNNNNIELDLFSSFLRKRINFSLTYYYKHYKDFNHLYWSYDVNNNLHSDMLNFGKVTKDGYEINGDFHFIRNKSLDWLMNLSFSKNSTEFEHNKDFRFSDTTIRNNIFSIVNNFRYKNFQLSIAFEGKNGYDINLYGNNIIVAEPFSYRGYTQITEINNKGVPISKELFDYEKRKLIDYITDTDYFILKQIGLQYQINDHARNKTYVIGLQYNKMRRLYLYVNDIEKYQEQFQKPSFYNAISLSFTMKF